MQNRIKFDNTSVMNMLAYLSLNWENVTNCKFPQYILGFLRNVQKDHFYSFYVNISKLIIFCPQLKLDTN